MSRENFFMYAILLIFTIFVWFIEKYDIKCPHLSASEEECKSEGGMSFSHTRPNEHDTYEELLNKIHKASGAEQNSIKWRRAFLIAVSITIITALLLNSKNLSFDSLPDWKIIYISILIAYTVILANFMYYSYHVFGVAEGWIKHSVDILRGTHPSN